MRAIVLCRVVAAVAAISLGTAGALRAQSAPAAEVVGVQGTGEHRPTEQQDWKAAQIKQGLGAGEFVRTGELSRMGLLFADQTQIRLNQNAMLQIKQVGGSQAGDSTVLSLLGGRAWSQSKVAPKKLLVETPSATAAIRGTDWELSVDDQGASTLTVLSGEVEFYNDFGTLVVRQGQQARAEVGRAPITLVITNPRDRVQWVTAYSVDPLRHVALRGWRPGELQADAGDSAAAPLVRAGALADLGRWDEARSLFDEALATSPDDPEALIGSAFVALHEGDTARALQRLDRAAGAAGGRAAELRALGRAGALILDERFAAAVAALEALVELPDLTQSAPYLLLGDLMISMGETDRAIEYIERGKARFPDDERLESALARIYLLADRPQQGRAEVQQALTKNPQSVEPYLSLGDLARTEGNAEEARAAYLAAAALKPAEARAWYGLGVVNNEKEEIRPGRRHLERALDLNPNGPGYGGELGTLETFANRLDVAESAYQQALATEPDDYVALTGLALLELKRGRAEAALEHLLRASLLEPRYARAHMYMAVAYYRLGQVDKALAELERASELDPKDPFPHMLRSIIHTDVIDPGGALDAARTARDLMPFLKSLNQIANDQKGTANLGNAFAFFGMEEWAQHLAHESYYPYWAGSHLFLGDRYPGLFTKNSEYFQGVLVDPTVFGGSNRFQTILPKPDTYVSGALRGFADDASSGLRPVATVNGYQNGLVPLAYFAELENTQLDPADSDTGLDRHNVTAAMGVTPTAHVGLFGFGAYNDFSGDVVTGQTVAIETGKVDAGLHVRLGPTSVIWAKWGGGRDNNALFDDTDPAQTLDFAASVDSNEIQLRHTFSGGSRHEVSYGVETGDRSRVAKVDIIDPLDPAIRIRQSLDVEDDSFLGYVSDRVTLGERLSLQGDLFVQRYDRAAITRLDLSAFGFTTPDLYETDGETRIEPRAGAIVRFGPGRLARIAYQRWRRPASVSTLAPVDTVGIPLSDQLVDVGGAADRYRAQIEWEWSPSTFTTGFFDHHEARHQTLAVALDLTSDLRDLLRLRTGTLTNTAAFDLLEGVPEYSRGIVRSGGAALNQVLSRTLSIYGRWIATDSENTGEEFRGARIPYLPAHLFSLGATWIGPNRLYVSGQGVRRTERWTNEANTRRLEPGWSGTVRAYWELPNKRLTVAGVVDRLFAPDVPTQYGFDVRVNF